MNGRRWWLLILVGIAVQPNVANAQQPGHGFHPPMPGQKLFVHCRTEGGESVEVALDIPSPSMPGRPNQLIQPPKPLPPLKVEEYLPQARLEQEVVAEPGEAGAQAILVAIEGPTQAYRRWLVANDTRHNRLVSFIGTWRYMAVNSRQERELLYGQFRDELTRDPTVTIRASEGERAFEFAALAGRTHRIEDLGCTVRILRFYPHFGRDDKTGQAVNQSDQRLNPAALVELELKGRREERWIFARFPEYTAGKARDLPLEVTLDCPLAKQSAAPDFAVVTVGRAGHELWQRYEGRTTSRPLALEQPQDIVRSQYKFHIGQYVASGRLIEEYRPTTGRGTTSALKVATQNATGRETHFWLELGKERYWQTPHGSLAITFGPRQTSTTKGHR